jgi:hypothetical protein
VVELLSLAVSFCLNANDVLVQNVVAFVHSAATPVNFDTVVRLPIDVSDFFDHECLSRR